MQKVPSSCITPLIAWIKIWKLCKKYVGVCFHKSSNTWFSRILIDGKRKFLGAFENEYDAHLAYQKELNNLT